MSPIRVHELRIIPKVGRIEIGFMLACLWYYIIPSAADFNFMLVLGAVAIYLFIEVQRVPVQYAKEVGKVILCALIIAGCYWLFTDTATIQKNVSMYQLKRYLSKFQQVAFAFLPLFFFTRLVFAGTRRQKVIIASTVVLLLGYTLTQTWQELLINQYATRSWGGFAEMSAQDVGTYGFVYAISALIPVLMILVFNLQRYSLKILFVAVIVILFAFLLRAQYTLSLLLAAVAIAIYIWKNTKNAIAKAVVFFTILTIYLALPVLLAYVASHVESSQISIRLQEIANALTGGELGYNLEGRLRLYTQSIQAFFASPIWGNRRLEFDGHATLLTVLSDVGLLGGIPYYYLYFSSRKRVNSLLGDALLSKQFTPIFVMFLMLGFTNPIHSTMPLYPVIWLLAPLVIDLTNE